MAIFKSGMLLIFHSSFSFSCNEDIFATMLFNDEVHTYEEVC